MDIISSLAKNKSQNSLYISDSENSNRSEETISFTCYNKKKDFEETHTFSLEEWNNYLQTVDSIHLLQCIKCNRTIDNKEYVKNGEFIYKSGEKIIEKCNYINGKLDGLYERFYLNGIHYEKTNYKNGVYHGSCEFWYDITGKKMKSMHFENGKLNGPYKYWDQNGKLIEDFYFTNGIRCDDDLCYYSMDSKSPNRVVLIKLPSKNHIDTEKLDNKYIISVNDNQDIIKENVEENIENIFDLSKSKKGKKEKKEKKEKKNKKDKYDSSDSDIENL